jgi:hypothetical protein
MSSALDSSSRPNLSNNAFAISRGSLSSKMPEDDVCGPEMLPFGTLVVVD